MNMHNGKDTNDLTSGIEAPPAFFRLFVHQLRRPIFELLLGLSTSSNGSQDISTDHRDSYLSVSRA